MVSMTSSSKPVSAEDTAVRSSAHFSPGKILGDMNNQSGCGRGYIEVGTTAYSSIRMQREVEHACISVEFTLQGAPTILMGETEANLMDTTNSMQS